MPHRYFTDVVHSARAHRWRLRRHALARGSVGDLVAAVADAVMAQRCAGCPHHLARWSARVAGDQQPHAPTTAAALRAFIRPVFGLPGAPGHADHVQGYVAEHLWYALVEDATGAAGAEPLVCLEAPKFSTTSPGGDGLAVHRLPTGALMFRLWEIKKAAGTAGVSRTVTGALRQLNTRAAEYLAEWVMTGHGRTSSDPAVAQLYAYLVDHWLTASPSAAAGVSVATSAPLAPVRCFTTLGTHFPTLAAPNRLRGLLAVVDDLPAFAIHVQQRVWTGL